MPRMPHAFRRFLLMVLLAATTVPALSQQTDVAGLSSGRRFVRRTTDLACLLPAATGVALGITYKDKAGLLQLGVSTASTLALNYGLELSIRKRRPDGTGHHAFPSTHAALAFDGATYLQKHYGWTWGVPAYAVATYVAWGRVYAKRHDAWDVLAGAAIGTGCAFLLSREYEQVCTVSAAPMLTGDGAKGFMVNVTF
ncbi:MAG: phosphatase PAP2 family protein [Alloprevotella sp.]|nr:phosphatase PAP2 family protein [Alloprevotella sp.]